LTVVNGVSLASALDTTGLIWNTGGDAPWEGELATTHDGTDAAQSMTISDNQESWLETTITNGPGQLSFWSKVSSEFFWDSLEFSIDGVVQGSAISGEVDWEQMNYFIPAGNHLVTIELRQTGVRRFALIVSILSLALLMLVLVGAYLARSYELWPLGHRRAVPQE